MYRRMLCLNFLVFATLAPAESDAGIAIFDAVTDSIQISGDTELGNTATFEAVVRFPTETGEYGFIYNEWQAGLEDKQFSVGPSSFGFYLFPLQPLNTPFSGNYAMTRDVWHHVAYVYDGAEQRYYVDGELVLTAALSGAINDSSGLGYVGAIPRDGVCRSSFIGHLESLRLSAVARYSGATFEAESGDFASDADTVLLYNFNEIPGSGTVEDSGPLGRTGTLGIGCTGATAPDLEGGPPTTTTLPPTTTTTTLPTGECADPIAPLGTVSASDALRIVQVAVGIGQCAPCVCDVDGSGTITATDGLLTLNAAVGQAVALNCPACS